MKTKDYLLYIVKLLSPYKKRLLIIVTLMFLTSGISMTLPILQKKLIDEAIISKNLSLLLKLIGVIIFISTINTILVYVQSKIQVKVSNEFNKSLQMKTMDRLLKIQKNVLDKEGVLNLYNNANFCVESSTFISGQSTLRLFIETFKFIGVLIGLFLINWKLSLFCLLFIPLKSNITIYFGKKIKLFSKDNVKFHKELHRWEEGVLNNVTDIKLNNMYDVIGSSHECLLNEIFKVIEKLEMFGIKDTQFGNMISDTIYYAIFLISSYMIWNSTLTIGGLMVITSYFAFLLEPVAIAASFKIMFSKIIPIIDDYEEFLNIPIEKNIGLESCVYKPNLSFNSVSFSYDKDLILRNVNLNIKYGEKVALVGDNGSGKSTLIDLILRFNIPCEGEIRVGEYDIQEISIESYRDLFSVLTQSNNLFNDTIENNITLFGINSIDYSLLNGQLFEFNKKFNHGMDTIVGSNSSMISGGEKQKILLARTLLKNAPIIIMDEPTANYDMESIKRFNKLINTIDKTVIIVSHEEDILRYVDKIILVKDKEVNMFRDYHEYINYNRGKK